MHHDIAHLQGVAKPPQMAEWIVAGRFKIGLKRRGEPGGVILFENIDEDVGK